MISLTSERLLPALCALVLVAGACSTPPDDSLFSLPALDLGGVDLDVRSAIEEARARVSAEGSAASWGHLGMILQAQSFQAEAVSCYQIAARLDSGDARWPYLEGLLLDLNQPTEALAAYSRALEISGAAGWISLAAADLLWAVGDPASAVTHYETALADDRAAPFALVGLARIELDSNPQKSHGHLAEALRHRWHYRQAHLLMSQVLEILDRKDEAQIHRWCAKAGTDLDPFDPIRREVAALGLGHEWCKKRGLGLFSEGQFQEARVELERAVVLAPSDVTHRVNLGTVLAAMGLHERALTTFESALEVNPSFQKALNLCARVAYVTGDEERAVELFEQAIEVDPSNDPEAVEAHFNLSALRSDRRVGKAHLEAALAINPGHVDSLLRLGGHLHTVGQVGQAVELWLRAVRIDPFQTDTALKVASLLITDRRHKEAVEILRKASVRAPGERRLHLLLAWQLATVPDENLVSPAEALEIASRITAGQPPDLASADVLAAALAASGRFDQAVEVVSKALDLARTSHPESVPELEQRRRLYQSGVAFLQPGG